MTPPPAFKAKLPERVVYEPTEPDTSGRGMWIASAFVIAGCCTFGIIVMGLSTRPRAADPPAKPLAATPTASFRPAQPPPEDVPAPAPQPTRSAAKPAAKPSSVRPAGAVAVTRPTAANEGQFWDLDDLCNYLSQIGLEFRQSARGRATVPGVWLTAGDGPNAPAVLVSLHASPAAARASLEVGRAQAGASGGYAWGRFSLIGSPSPLFNRVRQALAN
jgi:hypothetical protein